MAPKNPWVSAPLTLGCPSGHPGLSPWRPLLARAFAISSVVSGRRFSKAELRFLGIPLPPHAIWPVLLWGKRVTWPGTQGRWLWRKVRRGTCAEGDAGGEAETLTGPLRFGRQPETQGAPGARGLPTERWPACGGGGGGGDRVFMGRTHRVAARSGTPSSRFRRCSPSSRAS